MGHAQEFFTEKTKSKNDNIHTCALGRIGSQEAVRLVPLGVSSGVGVSRVPSVSSVSECRGF